MFTSVEWIYVAKDGKKFFSEEECAKYEREKFPKHRYVVTFRVSFTTAYEINANTEEEAIEEARQEFDAEYEYDTVELDDIQCDDDEED